MVIMAYHSSKESICPEREVKMLNKSEKKYLLLKITAVILVVFFAVMAFVNPKPTVIQVEKPYTVSENAK